MEKAVEWVKTVKLLKNAAIIVVFSIFVMSCNAQQKQNTTKEKEITTNENKMKTIKLNKADFLVKIVNYETTPNEWKYLGDKPAIIDFYADWCGPCRMVSPLLEELADEYSGKIYIYKIDTDKEQELAGLFGIRSIPSILFIPMNGQPQMSQGALPKSELKRAIDDFLLASGKK